MPVQLVFAQGAGIRRGELAHVTVVADTLVFGQNVLLEMVLLGGAVLALRAGVADLVVDALLVLLDVDLGVGHVGAQVAVEGAGHTGSALAAFLVTRTYKSKLLPTYF